MKRAIFKEKKTVEYPGLRPFVAPDHFPSEIEDDIEYVLFPYLVRENLVTSKQAEKLLLPYRGQKLSFKERHKIIFDHIPQKLAKQYRSILKKRYPRLANKPLIMVFTTDTEDPYPVTDDIICVRTSMLASNRRGLDIACPFPLDWVDDKGARSPAEASVGFCGIPNNNIYRAKLIEQLFNSAIIQTNFIFRNRFWGHLRRDLDAQTEETLKQEFVDNMNNNIFNVCSRGAGNYSIRFYETLRAGRIPVLLASDMVLPFEDKIRWDELIICKETPEEVESSILDWIKNRDLVAIQKQCRKTWEEYLDWVRFLEHLPDQLKNLTAHLK